MAGRMVLSMVGGDPVPEAGGITPITTPGREIRNLQKIVLAKILLVRVSYIEGPNAKGRKETSMEQIELAPETRAVLDRIRHSDNALSIFEMPADLAEAAVWEIGKLVLEKEKLPMVQANAYRWYLREVSKLLRTRTGWNLALELEICLRKWDSYRLNLELLQKLLRECIDRIGSMSPEDIEADKPQLPGTNVQSMGKAPVTERAEVADE